ncbi:hypothetical protein FP026_08435 [Rhizobium tropici]|uniref:Helix-turn-helix domain-containing protein n=1 Tax=Rhizobium tropici TaxID=398 RepID=A0A5B0W5C2_RHITR|nr:hypothetical protein [Rhizobium tropici]KAA1182104.1 hypothetical protein FP026_08435 [Rhizobium tropici]
MNQHKRKVRKPTGERFFQMHQWLVMSEAWKAATVYERCLYMELKQRYNGQNNGDIALSHREAMDALNCSNKPIAEAFRGLLDKGFIKVAMVGSFHWKAKTAGGRSTRWILTELAVDQPERSLVPTKDFMQWRPASEEKQRYAHGTRMAVSDTTAQEHMVVPGHTIKPKVYAHGTR